MSDELIAKASEIGKEHGTNAAQWVFDGNTDTATYIRYYKGIEDCDPLIMDSLPNPATSGESGEGYTARDIERDFGIDPDTETEDFGDICDAYELAFNSAVAHEVTRIAAMHLTFYCSYCEFYGYKYRGTFEDVETHALVHPINVDPLPVEN